MNLVIKNDQIILKYSRQGPIGRTGPMGLPGESAINWETTVTMEGEYSSGTITIRVYKDGVLDTDIHYAEVYVMPLQENDYTWSEASRNIAGEYRISYSNIKAVFVLIWEDSDKQKLLSSGTATRLRGRDIRNLAMPAVSMTYAQWSAVGVSGTSHVWTTGSNYDNSALMDGDVVCVAGTVSDKLDGGGNPIGCLLTAVVSIPSGSDITNSVTAVTQSLIIGQQGDKGDPGIPGPAGGSATVNESTNALVLAGGSAGTYYTASETDDLLDDKSDKTQDAHHSYYVKGTQTASTGSWTGNLPDVDALYEGLTIDYWLPFAGSGNATLNLTLADGTQTGPIPLYYGATSRVTTTQPATTVWRYVYQTVTISNVEYTGWWAIRAYLDGNTTDIVNLYMGTASFSTDTPIYRYQLVFQIDENTVTPLNAVSNSQKTNKTMLTNVAFDPFGYILYHGTTTTLSTGTGSSMYYHRQGVDLRYTLNCGTTLTESKFVYLKVIPQSNGMVKLAADPCWTQDLPATNDGYWYIRLGRAYSTYQISFYTDHPVYMYDGTRLVQLFNGKMDAPKDGGYYVRRNGAWADITSLLGQ